MKTAIFSFAFAALFFACGSNSSSSDQGETSNPLSELLGGASGELAPTQLVSIKNFSLEVPEYMTEATDLNAEASLQYQNIVKETYVVVIDEPKEEFIKVFTGMGLYDESMSAIENYAQFQSESLVEMMNDISDRTDLAFTESNGLKRADFTLTGMVADVPDYTIYYVLGYVEGASTMYTIMGWTLESRKDRYGADLEQMVASFKEVS